MLTGPFATKLRLTSSAIISALPTRYPISRNDEFSGGTRRPACALCSLRSLGLAVAFLSFANVPQEHSCGTRNSGNYLIYLATPAGLEPATP